MEESKSARGDTTFYRKEGREPRLSARDGRDFLPSARVNCIYGKEKEVSRRVRIRPFARKQKKRSGGNMKLVKNGGKSLEWKGEKRTQV